jgi:hypothetical protein
MYVSTHIYTYTHTHTHVYSICIHTKTHTQFPCMELQYMGHMNFQYGTISSHKAQNFVAFLFP